MVATSVMELKNKQKVITIPKAIADARGLRKGDKVEWRIDEFGNIVIRKA